MYWKAQDSFVGGSVSEKVYGKVDTEQYQRSVSKLLNFKVSPHGGVTRRGGLKFGWQAKKSDKNVRLIPFEYSSVDSYVLELGELYMRFGKYGERVDLGEDPLELATPYLDEELFEIKFVQMADVMWITHDAHAPRKLLRYSETEWYLQPIPFIDGPYMPINGNPAMQLKGSAATGTITVTAILNLVSVQSVEESDFPLYYDENDDPVYSGAFMVTTDNAHYLDSGDFISLTGTVSGTLDGVYQVRVKNARQFELIGTEWFLYSSGIGTVKKHAFTTDDIGRLIRMWNGSSWAWGEIVAYVDGLNVTVEVREGSFPTGFTTKWKLGKWSDANGWPGAVMLYELRIAYGGSPIQPQGLDFSQTDLFDWFQTARDETLLATDAIGWVLQSNRVDDIVWMLPGRGGLAVGTEGGCWIVTGAGGKDDPLTGDGSVSARKHVAVGASNKVSPVNIDNAVIFADKSLKKIYEFAYLFQEDTFRAPELSIFADHLFRESTIRDIDVQSTESLLWVVMNDGTARGLTYMRPENVVAWHSHETDGHFESVCCVSEGVRDVPYFVVKRFVNGQIVKYIEWLERDFDKVADIEDAYFLDCGVTVDNPLTISGVSKTNPVQVTIEGHNLPNNANIYIEGIYNETFRQEHELNGKWYKVNIVDADTVSLAGEDGTGFSTYVSGGEARKEITVVSGLDHLEGRSLFALVDGKVVVSGITVSGGSVTLPYRGRKAHIGINFMSDLETLPIEAATDSGSTVGRHKELGEIAMRVYRTHGCKVGSSEDTLEEVIFNENVEHDSTPDLFSGEKRVDSVEGGEGTDIRIYVRQDLPLPLNLTALTTDINLNEE